MSNLSVHEAAKNSKFLSSMAEQLSLIRSLLAESSTSVNSLDLVQSLLLPSSIESSLKSKNRTKEHHFIGQPLLGLSILSDFSSIRKPKWTDPTTVAGLRSI
ncbi:hypothetical protein H0H81_012037 [Sphagnurus paluster]|uniref:Uncharacterized protein n=1 Tax=Sphagnurus paluster TaxID=117069 RepID=A0A9P7FTY5_9AGAR|nr:hypothetical protein H0H81_012037 [Sphagnurus paluster]